MHLAQFLGISADAMAGHLSPCSPDGSSIPSRDSAPVLVQCVCIDPCMRCTYDQTDPSLRMSKECEAGHAYVHRLPEVKWVRLVEISLQKMPTSTVPSTPL